MIEIINGIQGWINEVFGINDEKSSTILITLLVFITGLLVRRSSIIIQGLLERKRMRQLWKRSLKNFLPKMIALAEAFDKTKSSLEIRKTENVTLEFKTPSVPQMYGPYSLDFTKAQIAFFHGIENNFCYLVILIFSRLRIVKRGNRIDAFSSSWLILEEVKQIIEQAKSYKNTLLEVREKLEGEFHDLSEKEFLLSVKIISENDKNDEIASFAKALATLRSKNFSSNSLLNSPDGTAYFVGIRDNFIYPVKGLIRSDGDKPYEAIELLSIMIRFSEKVDLMEDLDDEAIGFYGDFQSRLKKHVQDLRSHLSTLNW
jgi:hypothetical protein